MRPHLLALAAIPPLLGSLWFLEYSSASRGLLVQQAAIGTLAFLATLVAVRFMKPSYSSPPHGMVFLALAAVLFAPLLGQVSAGPHRWVGMAGFRLYVAPVVVPLFLVLWHRALTSQGGAPRASSLSATLAGAALFAQPDAAQLTAFAVGAVPLVWCSVLFRRWRLPVICGALLAAAVSWGLPDPLAPVPYVEGVFQLAASSSYGVLAAAVVAAALPVAALAWLAYSMSSTGLLAVALYLGVLLLLAPMQVTPVPLLGFGAGPVLGYFLMASQAWRQSATELLPSSRTTLK